MIDYLTFKNNPYEKKTFLLLLFIVFNLLLHAQLNDIEYNEWIKNKDLVILNENTEIEFKAKKAYYIEMIVHKDITYQILKNSGNNKINPVILPEKPDEVYEPHNNAIRNEQRIFDQAFVINFDAGLVQEDSTETEIEKKAEMVENRVIASDGHFGKIHTYRYTFPQFASGDIVHFRYSYSIPFVSNWQKLLSSRIFLETSIPRKKYTLTFSHHNNLVMDFKFFNGAIPGQTEMENRKYYKWTCENQPGCLEEPGAHPYSGLPCFTFSTLPYEFLYTHFNSFIEEFIPAWYFLSYDREAKIRKAYVDDYLGVQNRDNHCINRVSRRYTNMLPNDTIGLGRLRYFQRYIVDSARYDDAYELYNWFEGNRKLSPGCDLASGFIRDPNTEVIYANILPKLGCQFFTGYLDDVRSGEISEAYLAPAYDNEMLFAAVTTTDEIVLVLPKSDKRNLYCEELPFYYENVPILLLFTYDFAGYKRNFNDIFRLILTPASTLKDNYRKVNSMVYIDIENKKLNFNTRISLSGQYSTLTYPVYTNDSTDASVNPKYFEAIWDIGEDTEVKTIQAKGKKCYFPFKSSAEAEYSSALPNSKNDDVITLDFGKWIKHIYYEDMDHNKRFTDFYADFTGIDLFNYMITFDKPVVMLAAPESIEIDNSFGTYKFSIKQTDKSNILLTSYFCTKSTHISKSDISYVHVIFDALEQIKNKKLVLKPE